MDAVVEVVDPSGLRQVHGPVGDLVEAVLAAESRRGAVVVAFLDEQAMTDLNGRYRALYEPTDVLSFRRADENASWPGESDLSPAGVAIPDLGEVAVCPAVVRRYAEEEGRDPGAQLGWALIHGVLHLVGYDHEKDNGEMRVREQELLGELEYLVRAVSIHGLGRRKSESE